MEKKIDDGLETGGESSHNAPGMFSRHFDALFHKENQGQTSHLSGNMAIFFCDFLTLRVSGEVFHEFDGNGQMALSRAGRQFDGQCFP